MRIVKKTAGYLHLWLGLISGSVVFIVALTGALLTFEEEVERFLISPDWYYVKPENGPQLPIDTLMQIATPELIKLKDGGKASRVFFSTKPDRSVIIGYNYQDSSENNHRGHVFINPYTGAVLGLRSGNPHHVVWGVLAEIHINLWLGDFGNFVVKWCTIIFLIMVISGIVLWWPKNKSAFRQRYKFRWKNTTRWKRKNYDLHNILGFYACWIVIFMIVTGAMWAFEWFNNGVYFLTSGGMTMETPPSDTIRTRNTEETNKMYPFVPAQYVIAEKAFKEKYPSIYNDSDEICIGYFANENEQIMDISSSFDPDGLRSSRYISASFDKSTNKITKDNFDDIKNFGDSLQQSTNELHYGTYFGLTSKVATFLACLIAASLPITGFMIWLGRKK